jgi:hypothetical protein
MATTCRPPPDRNVQHGWARGYDGLRHDRRPARRSPVPPLVRCYRRRTPAQRRTPEGPGQHLRLLPHCYGRRHGTGARTLRLPAFTLAMPRRESCREERQPCLPGLPQPLARSVQYLSGPAHAHGSEEFARLPSHVLRKSAATELDRAGLSARQLADQLGYSTVTLAEASVTTPPQAAGHCAMRRPNPVSAGRVPRSSRQSCRTQGSEAARSRSCATSPATCRPRVPHHRDRALLALHAAAPRDACRPRSVRA